MIDWCYDCFNDWPKPLPASQEQTLSTEAQQEALLRAKYGGLLPKKKSGVKDHKFFDSADWALSQQGRGQQGSQSGLEPKLGPTVNPGRRTSQLGQ